MAAANNRQPAGIPIHNTRFVRFVMPQTLTFCIKDSRPFLYSRRPGCPRPRAALKSGILIKRKPTGRRSKAVYLKKSGTFRGNRVHTLTGSAPILYNKRENPGPDLRPAFCGILWADGPDQNGRMVLAWRSKDRKKAGGGGKYWWGVVGRALLGSGAGHGRDRYGPPPRPRSRARRFGGRIGARHGIGRSH